MAKQGMQFIIEVEEIFYSDEGSKPLYRIKGFDSLVFDDYGLSKLMSLQEYKMHLLTDIMQNFTKKHDNERSDR